MHPRPQKKQPAPAQNHRGGLLCEAPRRWPQHYKDHYIPMAASTPKPAMATSVDTDRAEEMYTR